MKTRGRARPQRRRQPLTRERIVRAALDVMDAEGLEAVSMRRLGRELGVEAMSLYNHVADKHDILDGVTDLVMREFRMLEGEGGSWIGRARTASREWRRLLKAHPSVITLLAGRDKPLTSPDALQPMELALGLLKEAGLSDRDAVQAFRAVGGYIMGFVLMEAGNIAPGASEGLDDAEFRARMAGLPADRLPTFLSLLPELEHCDNDETFELGLDLILEGIRARTAGEASTEGVD